MSTGEVELARCYCCGLTEECTPAYIARVRERYGGLWICGLCSEAINDGSCAFDEAMRRHVNFCRQFRSSNPGAHDFIAAVKHILCRRLNSPRSIHRVTQ